MSKIEVAALTILILALSTLMGCLIRDTYTVTRACLELGYSSAAVAHRMCRTRVNGTDIVVPLERAKTLPRPGQ